MCIFCLKHPEGLFVAAVTFRFGTSGMDPAEFGLLPCINTVWELFKDVNEYLKIKKINSTGADSLTFFVLWSSNPRVS